MKKRILSIITTLALVLPMLCMFNLTAYAADQAQVIKPDGTVTTYWSHQTAWAAAVECGGTFKLVRDWVPLSRDFSTEAIDDEKNYFKDGALCVPKEKSVTIDLNGHHLSRNLYHSYNDAIDNGSVIRLEQDARLTIKDDSQYKDGIIEDGNTTDDGGGIYAEKGSRIYMYGGRIGYCQAEGGTFYKGEGGGVYLESGAMMFMYGGKIERNLATTVQGYGGAVYVESDARFYMYGGEISYNKTTNRGEAIYGETNSHICLKGGVISHNDFLEAYKSSGYVIYTEGYLELDGTEVAYNRAQVDVVCARRGVYIGGSVHDNNSEYGCGIAMTIITFSDHYMYFGGDIKVYNNYCIREKCYSNLYAGYSIPKYQYDLCFGNYSDSILTKNVPFKEGAMIGYYNDLDGKDSDKLTKAQCITDDRTHLEKYFFSDRGDNRAAVGVGTYSSSDTDSRYLVYRPTKNSPDSFISKITAVKRADGTAISDYKVDTNPSYSASDAAYYTVQNNITIHVPNTSDIDLSSLAVEFETSGTSSSQPVVSERKSGSLADFTKPVTYTLLNQDGLTQQNRFITIVKDLNVPTYNLTVNSGTGSGTYTAGSKVTVSADDVENKKFKEWTFTGIELSEEQKTSQAITFTMPGNAVTLTATYLDLTTSVEMTLDVPYGGKPLDDSVTIKLSDGTTGEIPAAWSPAAGTADFETTYNAVITLASTKGFSKNLSIKLNGEELTDTNIKKPDDKTLVITKAYTTLKAKLLSIPTAELTVAHGTAMADIIAKLPTEINIVTENKAVSTASVEWNTDALAASGYDPTNDAEYTFTVDGTITLPDKIDQNGISLDTQIKITAEERTRPAMPTSNLINGASYDEMKKLTLSHASDSSKIYYTTDGSEPTESSILYSDDSPIILERNDKTDRTYIIKAISVTDQEGLQRYSKTAVFKITILAPAYEVKVVDASGNTAGLGGGKYHEGDTVTVQTSTITKGYVFKNWSTDDIDITDEQMKSPFFTFTMPTKPVTITANFIRTVQKIAINIDEPDKNEELDKDVNYYLYDGDDKKILDAYADIAWTPSYPTAQPYTEYTAMFTLKPKYGEGGYVFDDNVTVEPYHSSSDMTAECVKNDDGSVTVIANCAATLQANLTDILYERGDVWVEKNKYTDSSEILHSDLLPKTVQIETDCGIYTAEVGWYQSQEYNDGDITLEYCSGTVQLPENVGNGSFISCNIHYYVYLLPSSGYILPPEPDVLPGVYTENQTINLSLRDSDSANGAKIMYRTDGEYYYDEDVKEYTGPIVTTAQPGERQEFKIVAWAVSSDGTYDENMYNDLNYTIDIPVEKETVNVIGGIGSGEYKPTETINLYAQPEIGKVFTSWTVEAVKYTTETQEIEIEYPDGKGGTIKEIITRDVTIRTVRELENNPLSSTANPVTALTVPELQDDETLEITAQSINAIADVSLKAAIPSCGELMPTTMTTSNKNVTVSNFTVTPNDTKAKADTQYTMTATLTAKDGYVFGENPLFTVNGALVSGIPIIVSDENNNVVITGYTVSYAFKTGIPTQNIEFDMANGKAYITADKEYTNPVVLFAAHNNDELVCVKFIYHDLDAGINEIDIPDDFSSENANTVTVMVWNNLKDIVPLFGAYEKIKS